MVDVEAAVHEADDCACAVVDFAADFRGAFVDGVDARVGLGLAKKLTGLDAEGDALDLVHLRGRVHLGGAHAHDGHVLARGQNLEAAGFQRRGVLAGSESDDNGYFVAGGEGSRKGLDIAGAALNFGLKSPRGEHGRRGIELALRAGAQRRRGCKREEDELFHIDCVVIIKKEVKLDFYAQS